MTAFDHRVREGSSTEGRYRVYFTCHPDDFSRYFGQIASDILKTHDCVIYYTNDLSKAIEEVDGENPLSQMALLVVPVTFKLLTKPSRAMDSDIPFAKEHGISILPFLMESGKEVLDIYSKDDKFGKRQYINPASTDDTEIGYVDKLRWHLNSVLADDELLQEIRSAFYTQIFLSYRKKDRAFANSLMRIIHDIPGCQDISIWYDEYLAFGEDWRESILSAMRMNSVFTLLVRPSLLEEGNFVMGEEYPRAKEDDMDILPVKMGEIESSECDSLSSALKPNRIVTPDDEEFRARFLSIIGDRAKEESDPRHKFLIGLAYLDGIGVEKDKKRAIKLITSAAEGGVTEAIQKLINIYGDVHSPLSEAFDEMLWRERLLTQYRSIYPMHDERTLSAMIGLAYSYGGFPDKAERAKELLAEWYELVCHGLDNGHPDRLAAEAQLIRWACYSSEYGFINELLPTLISYISDDGCTANENLLNELRGVARALSHLGDYDEELTVERAILKHRSRGENRNDEEIALCLNRIADLSYDLGERNDALLYKKDAYLAFCRAYGEESDKAVIILVELCDLYRKLGMLTEGRALMMEAYEKVLARLGNNHPLTVRVLYHLAFADIGAEEYISAKERLYTVYEWRRTYLGESHEDTVMACFLIAKVYYLLKEYKVAAARFEKTIPQVRTLYDAVEDFYSLRPYEDLFEDIYTYLVDCHLFLKNYPEAYECQKKVCQYIGMREPFGDSEDEAAAIEKLNNIKKLLKSD